MAVREVQPDPGTGRAAARESRDPRDATRRRIVDVAVALIADHGFAATTTREIAEHLGFTKAALYYHFRTKDDLLAAIMEPAVDDLSVLVASGEPHLDGAARRRIVEGYIDVVLDHRDLIRVLFNDPSVRHGAVRTLAEPLYHRLIQLLAGTTAPDTAQRTRVRATLGAINVALLRAADDDDPVVVRATTQLAACGALGIAHVAT
ncbi:MAG: TetR/AcrR family transcriptional regulator [Acidimicrobiales bacterium]